MERKDRMDALGGTILVAFSALLGFNQVLVKLVNAGMSPIFQAGLRSALAFFPVLVFALLVKRRLSVSDGSLLTGILCGLIFAAEFLLLFSSLEYTTVSRASLFFYTMPFWIAVAGHFLIEGERLRPVHVAGLALALAGVALALADNSEPATDWAILGDVMCLAAAMCWAAIVLLVRTTALSRSSPEMQLLYQLSVSAVVLIPLSPLFGEVMREMTPALTAIFAFQVLVVVCVGFLTWFWIVSIYPAADIASFAFLAPVFGVMFGWLILGERLSSTIVVALVLVAVGITLVNRKAEPART